MSLREIIDSGFVKILAIIVIAIQITACGDDSGDAGVIGNNVSPASVVLGGSVGDGPVTGAQVNVYSNSGQLLGSMVSDSSASYLSTLKIKGNEYPLLLKVNGGTDLVTGREPDFEMLSVMLKPSDKQVNINPFSTLIVKIAQDLPGGLDSRNVSTALNYVTGQLGFGLDTTLMTNPITSPVTDSNVANLVKSSEALGELVRRTRDLITATGASLSGDGVMDALAADMVDGHLDGRGAQGTRPTVTAVANVVSGQVLVEALSNNLRVGGVIATDVIDQSIVATRTGISATQLTDSVRITQGMLEQTRDSLAAAQVLDTSAAIKDVKARVAAIQADSLASEVSTSLPTDAPASLDYAISLSASVDEAQADTINQVASSDGTIDPIVSNSEPVISGSPANSVIANSSYVFQPSASDADGDTLAFSIANRPSWASFSSTTGRLSGTPDNGDAGTFGNIQISVTDGTATAQLPGFSIRVDAAVPTNTAPVISGTPATSVAANNSYVFQPSASDADGDTLGFSISNKPGWASFNSTTGRLSGTPDNGDAGTFGNIQISVTDGTATAQLPGFSIRVDAVVPANTAPVISGSPVTAVTANNSYVFQPSASDADGDSLGFSISNKPGWASFSSTTGRLSGTPDNGDAGTYGNIQISVTDGTATAQLQAFSIRVDAANTAPVISGSPATAVTVNDGYMFQPSASDPDGDLLAFSVSNKPGWASFDNTTGRLSGAPADTDVGTYSNIVISVSDGLASTSMPPFNLQVNAAQQQNGSFSLSWTAPATRADGTPLSLADIGGYRIYYGTTNGNFPNTQDVTDGTATSATVNSIPAGNYYVVMSTIDSSGLESAQSGAVVKVAQ